MQYSILALAFAALAVASPANILERQTSKLCPALDTPECCQADVDGVLSLTCEAPEGDPSTLAAFRTACADVGLSAFCCTVPVAGDGLVCDSV